MTARGRVVKGVIVLDSPAVLPEGAEVVIEVVDGKRDPREELREILLRHAGKGLNLPADLAERHDSCAHGKPRA